MIEVYFFLEYGQSLILNPGKIKFEDSVKIQYPIYLEGGNICMDTPQTIRRGIEIKWQVTIYTRARSLLPNRFCLGSVLSNFNLDH